MISFSGVRQYLRGTPARYWWHRLKALRGGAPQSDEAAILERLVNGVPGTFVEFGFHPTEFNCIHLRGFQGLLVDGDDANVRLARALLPARIEARTMFVTLENVAQLGSHFSETGVLSVDVDGNDYWFLEALLPTAPHVIAVEYNASFGLHPVSVPYDPAFDRSEKHPTGWYHGASLIALDRLCQRHGYRLVDVSAAGGNAFFVRGGNHPGLDARQAYRESSLRNHWSRTTAAGQWERVKDMPYVEIPG